MVNLLGLVFSVIAGVTGIAILWWTWLDRPRYTWRIMQSFDPWVTVRNPDGSEDTGRLDIATADFTMDIELHHEGTAVALGASLQTRGSTRLEGERLRATILSPRDEPLAGTLTVKADEEAFLELTWIQGRPARMYGMVWNLRTGHIYKWHWHWWSGRARKRPEEWFPRFVRTKGCWRPMRANPLHEIPADHPLPHPHRRWLPARLQRRT